MSGDQPRRAGSSTVTAARAVLQDMILAGETIEVGESVGHRQRPRPGLRAGDHGEILPHHLPAEAELAGLANMRGERLAGLSMEGCRREARLDEDVGVDEHLRSTAPVSVHRRRKCPRAGASG